MMNAIEVEFFGIARQRAQKSSATIAVDGSLRLTDILSTLSERFPDLVPDCIVRGRLTNICSANLNGDRFLPDVEFEIHPGDRLLIMSADAGG
ncbi:MoaD/ThiS family protein [Planctomycetota bacterium]